MTAAEVATPPPSSKQRLYLDVHELGPGKVKAGAVADAHRKDLATQARHGVHYRAYWVDEKKGRIYCLVDAPSADAAMAVHREAHGLVANKVQEVTGHSDQWAPAPGMKLYLDHHDARAGQGDGQGRRGRPSKGSRRSRRSTRRGSSTTGSMRRPAR